MSKYDVAFELRLDQLLEQTKPSKPRKRRRGSAGAVARYVPPHHYTAEELLDADIADLETDIRCAYRDGLPDYAKECEAQLKTKKARRAAMASRGGKARRRKARR